MSLAFRIVIGIKIVNIASSESSFNLQMADFTYKLWVIFGQFCLLASRTALYNVLIFIHCQWHNTPLETWEKKIVGFIIKLKKNSWIFLKQYKTQKQNVRDSCS